jgi:hypothetical protein
MKSRRAITRPLVQAIMLTLSTLPKSKERKSRKPEVRAKELIGKSSLRAAAVSGSLAIPGGVVGLLTVIPDLLATWKIQAQLVADIAAVYGRSSQLEKEELMYCLFNYGRQSPVKDFVVRVGERLIVRKASIHLLEQLSEKIGVKVLQKIMGRGFSRLVPLVGALSVARYARQDTRLVGANARDLFSKEIVKKDKASA